MGGTSSAEAAQQRRLILPDFDGRIWVDAVKLMLKILLDDIAEDEEESDDESDEEEVMGIDAGESDDDPIHQYAEQETDELLENEDDDEDEGSEASSHDDEDKGLPSDKAWGKTKKLFYDADVKDDDIFGSDEEAEIAAEEEEKEAMSLQKRMAAKLDDADFDDFVTEGSQEPDKDDSGDEE